VRHLLPAYRTKFGSRSRGPWSNSLGTGSTNPAGALVGKTRSGWFVAERWYARSDFVARSTVPNRRDQKNKGDQATRDRTRYHARRGPPIPKPPTAARSRRVVPTRTADPRDLPRDVLDLRAATRTEIDKNPVARPAGSPPGADRW